MSNLHRHHIMESLIKMCALKHSMHCTLCSCFTAHFYYSLWLSFLWNHRNESKRKMATVVRSLMLFHYSLLYSEPRWPNDHRSRLQRHFVETFCSVSVNHSITGPMSKNCTSKCGEGRNKRLPPMHGMFGGDTVPIHLKVLACTKAG